MFVVYWICYTEHTDPKSEGYIGITSQNPKKRFQDHKCGKNLHLKNRCKQGYTLLKILHEGLEKEDARRIEKEYRPEANMGWNINPGGDIPPSPSGRIVSATTRDLLSKINQGRKHTQETRQKLSILQTGRKWTTEHKEQLSRAHKGLKLSLETKRRISEANCGHIVTEETRRLISETMKRKNNG